MDLSSVHSHSLLHIDAPDALSDPDFDIEADKEEDSMINSFWNQNIEFEDSVIEMDKAPICIMEATQMSKIHFLFTMLNVSQLNVINKGAMVGIITKNEFLKKRESKKPKTDVVNHVDEMDDDPPLLEANSPPSEHPQEERKGDDEGMIELNKSSSSAEEYDGLKRRF